MQVINKSIKSLFTIARITAFLLTILLYTNCQAQTDFKTVTEAKGLQAGDSVGDFSALDLHNNIFSLYNALKSGPVIVVFYRGQWCPYCNKHLSHLQDSLPLIYDKGATVIAISPEKVEFLEQSAEKSHASFSLLYDEGYKIADQFDVTFKPESRAIFSYNTFMRADLKNAHSDDSQRLPIPATFIIAKNAKIVWRHFDADYKLRSSVADIIRHIP